MAEYTTHEEALKNNPDCDLILSHVVCGVTKYEAAYVHEDGLYDHLEKHMDADSPYGGLFMMRTEDGEYSDEGYWCVSKQPTDVQSKQVKLIDLYEMVEIIDNCNLRGERLKSYIQEHLSEAIGKQVGGSWSMEDLRDHIDNQ